MDRGGTLFRRRRWFIASGTPPIEIRTADGVRSPTRRLTSRSSSRRGATARTGDAFYWTTAVAYTSEDIKALLCARQRNRERELEHAHADARKSVWERDEGRCVECGGDFDLQYDHIIPFRTGGASTVENLKLFCAKCNQAKGGRL